MWQTILAALISALTGLLQSVVNPLLDRYRFLPLLGAIFAAVDPVIKQNLPEMSSNDIYKAIQIAATDIAGGKLSQQEVDRLTTLAFQKFDIRIAANNGVVPQMDQEKLTTSVTDAISTYKAKQQSELLATIAPATASALLGTTTKSI